MVVYRSPHDVALTCRHFGIFSQSLYRRQRRYDPQDLTSLEQRRHSNFCCGGRGYNVEDASMPHWFRPAQLMYLSKIHA